MAYNRRVFFLDDDRETPNTPTTSAAAQPRTAAPSSVSNTHNLFFYPPQTSVASNLPNQQTPQQPRQPQLVDLPDTKDNTRVKPEPFPVGDDTQPPPLTDESSDLQKSKFMSRVYDNVFYHTGAGDLGAEASNMLGFNEHDILSQYLQRQSIPRRENSPVLVRPDSPPPPQQAHVPAPRENNVVARRLLLEHSQLDALQNMVLQSSAFQYSWKTRDHESDSTAYNTQETEMPHCDLDVNPIQNPASLSIQDAVEQYDYICKVATVYSHPKFAAALSLFVAHLIALMRRKQIATTTMTWCNIVSNIEHRPFFVMGIQYFLNKTQMTTGQKWLRNSVILQQLTDLQQVTRYFQTRL